MTHSIQLYGASPYINIPDLIAPEELAWYFKDLFSLGCSSDKSSKYKKTVLWNIIMYHVLFNHINFFEKIKVRLYK